jgi:hypothetical protein
VEKIAMAAELFSQKQVLKKLNNDGESKQRHLTTIWESFTRPDNPISPKEMLLQLALLTKKHSKADLRELRDGPENEDSD